MGVKDRILKSSRWGLAGLLIFVGGNLFWTGIDKAASDIFARFKPRLETQLSEPMGRSLLIGPYNGLRAWGVHIGPTKFKKGFNDNSSASFSGLTVKFAPIASLINGRPVAIIRTEGAAFNLRKNQADSYLVLGSSKQGVLPNIEIRFQLVEPAKVFIEPLNLKLNATTDASFKLVEKKISGFINLDILDQGRLFLKGKGDLNNLDFQAKARLEGINLQPYKTLFENYQVKSLKGKIDGDISIGVDDGLLNCEGDLKMVDFLFKGNNFKNSLTSNKTTINCRDNLVMMSPTTLKYGPWSASLSAKLPFDDTRKLNLGFTSALALQSALNKELKVSGNLPITLDRREVILGDVVADIDLKDFPLSSLSSLLGTSMSGNLSVKGQANGSIPLIKSNLSIELTNPQFSGVRLQEQWRGNFVGGLASGGEINLASVGAALPGNLTARIRKDWSLDQLSIKRLGGEISLKKNDEAFNWEAKKFRLDRVEVAITPEKSFNRIFGELDGKGSFRSDPLFVNSELILRYPRFKGLRLKEVQISGNLFNQNYSLTGEMSPPDSGQISFELDGALKGELWAKAKVNGISARWLTSTAMQIPKINSVSTTVSSSGGKAEDLGEFVVQTSNGSIEEKLKALLDSQLSLRENYQRNREKKFVDPDKLRGKIDGFIEIQGPDYKSLNLNLEASGNLWPKGFKYNSDIKQKSFKATLKGPIQSGSGEFSLLNIPFSIIPLFIPIPSVLKGQFGFSGEYKFKEGSPEITADLVVKDAFLDKNPFVLDTGKAHFAKGAITTDIKVRSENSLQPIKLKGQIPLKNDVPFDFRVESHGDGLKFLDGFSGGTVSFEEGTSDLRLLIRGTAQDPIANGFLAVRKGKVEVKDKIIEDLDSSMIFDFNRIEVQKLKARVGSQGVVEGYGAIGLFDSMLDEGKPLAISLKKVPLKISPLDLYVDSNLKFKGSLIKPNIGGELTLKEGFISPKKSSSNTNKSTRDQDGSKPALNKKRNGFLEQSWDFKQPLVLFVQNSDAPASKMLKAAIPKGFSSISFENLRLILGENLRIASQPFANFNATGTLLLNGSFDQSLNARGLIRLTNGRVNLFTTTFDLDRKEPNVAVFTPSAGLIPYVDVTMKSRVPDKVRDASDLSSSSDYVTNGSGSFGIGGSRFIKVELKASGPADRLSETFKLRSTPPLPANQLLGLIGGNSLTRLIEGREREVFANLLSKSLISPVLGNITGAFSEKFQLSLYPTYITSPKAVDETSNKTTTNSDEAVTQLSPQQAWVTEIGIDLSKRFNFSVQSTPNRKDIPPQGVLTYKVNSNLDVLGSLNKNGIWQSQLQMFLRF